MQKSRYRTTQTGRKPSRKRLVMILAALLIIAACVAVYLISRPDKKFVGNTSTAKKQGHSTAINKSRDSDTAVNPGGSSAQGGVVDTNGQASSPAPDNQWTTSPSGAITLKAPASHASLKSGDTLSGSATVSTVQFRLIDDAVGVIAQGQLNVVNGSFSGNLQFSSKSSRGRLDVFNYDINGAEANEVQIPVTFN